MEGILKWWLPEAYVRQGREEIQRVIDFLVSRGWVVERTIASSEKIYSVNQDRLQELQAFLEDLQKGTETGEGNDQ